MEQTEEIMKINILGSEWDVEYRNADIDPILQGGNGGYTDPSINPIVISNKRKDDDKEISST